MEVKKLSLDKYSEHYLEIFLAQDKLLIKLAHNGLDRRSTLHNNFKQNLFFQLKEQKLCFMSELDQTAFPLTNEIIIVYLGKFEQIKLATIKIIDLSLIIDTYYTLSPFETRFLAQNGFPHPVKEIAANLSNVITTDLHTHFAGCVSAKDLIRIGREYNLSYPIEILELAGIHTIEKEPLPLANLSTELQNILVQRLSIPLDRRVPFVGMEKIYKLRSPITKNIKTFIALCWQIAKDYQRMAVKYIELSFANVIYSSYLELLHKELPKIEKETGLTIRFLAAIGRSDDLEWDLDYIEQLKQMSASPYIVGVDFLGHETNSTYAFAQQITEIAKWADQNYPGFVIRVHAGENPAHPENIRAAMELTKNYKIQLRIGHGLFGVDEQTLAELKNIQAIVEFNLNSNLALNNIQTTREVPIKEYLDQEIAVVLGTDGYGIYQTAANIEVQAALLAGVTKEDLAKIQQTEEAYLLKRMLWDKNKQ
ncbi:MAG: hypothetical protein JNM06_04710, partial [Blastocatellia bacterium]|nr:hypothetical protein [Blastocatellia bacterium]